MKPIEISTVGKAVATSGTVVDFTESLFKKSVEAYDPSLHEAPLVIGHVKTDAPAYGWVESIQFAEDTLTAIPKQVDVQFAEMVNDGRFKKRSASFYTPDSPANPMPGVYYLRHVAFLGAEPPAIKGLKDVQFSEDGQDIITIEFSEASDTTATTDDNKINSLIQAMRDFFIPTETQADFSEPAKTDKPQSETTQSQEKEMPDDKDKVDFAEQQTKLDQQEAAIAKREQKLQRRDYEDFAESLIGKGILLPADKSGLVDFMACLPADSTVEFSEGDEEVKKPSLDWFKGFMKKQPVQVDFSERSAEDEEQEQSVDFSAPSDCDVDKERNELHQKALTYQRKHNVDYDAALSAVDS